MTDFIPILLGLATLLPLVAFFAILIGGAQMPSRVSSGISIAAIVLAALFSFASLGIWQSAHPVLGHAGHHGGHSAADHGDGHSDHGGDHPDHDGEKHHGKEDHDGDGHNNSGDNKDHESDARAAVATQNFVALYADTDAAADGHDHEKDDGDAAHDGHDHHEKPAISGTYWLLGKMGDLRIEISYYIDGLTLCMFAMVTLIASCIHFYATGYMHDEEAEVVTDVEVPTDDGHLQRPGRYHRFFQSLSLFCFSMLGLVLAGNIAMVFVFWELVGICSYFLIGFYIERKSASTAANKAFIVNRVGDFGMIIGLMALWSGLGTFSFGDTQDANGAQQLGMFSMVRPESAGHQIRVPDQMVQFSAQDEMRELMHELGPDATAQERATAIANATPTWREKEGLWGVPYGYWLLIVAGIGIFCGCVGKSAQFPLHVWLPDAMEGPTPVSALVHSATMVAAGVYLVGRFFPVFVPEVLLVIAIAGCITLFMAATIAITATDIKRVLAYSTISQLGYMMLALGLGGWLPGLLHLITHAFFKSLLFMCSGSVIHAVHTNEMPLMGGLRKKMPVTAYTMLVGCLAIAGAGIPFLVGFSGYYSKDKILEQAFSFMKVNGGLGMLFFLAAAGGAAITAFYMFRLWYMTFAGKPRDPERYEHAHESPKSMYVPLIILSIFAIGVAWGTFEAILVGAFGLIAVIAVAIVWSVQGKLTPSTETNGAGASHASDHDGHDSHDHGHDHGHGHDDHGHGFSLSRRGGLLAAGLFFVALLCFPVFWSSTYLTLDGLIDQARPVPSVHVAEGHAIPSTAYSRGYLTDLVWPDESLSHDFYGIVMPATITAFFTAVGGFTLATLMYGLGWLKPEEVKRQFSPIYRFLVNKWWFDELYEYLFIKPTHVVARWFAWIDSKILDGIIHWLARATKWFSRVWERIADRTIVDGLANRLAGTAISTGNSLRALQTGNIRQYVMFIVVGAVVVFLLVSFFWTPGVSVNG